jgi:hypothetical protein
MSVADDAGARCRTVAETIRRYLASHPSAADSEVGIAEWWLAELGGEGAVTDVREALDLLEREGVVEVCLLDDGRCVWRASTRRDRG